jgi:hypothetical protein
MVWLSADGGADAEAWDPGEPVWESAGISFREVPPDEQERASIASNVAA